MRVDVRGVLFFFLPSRRVLGGGVSACFGSGCFEPGCDCAAGAVCVCVCGGGDCGEDWAHPSPAGARISATARHAHTLARLTFVVD